MRRSMFGDMEILAYAASQSRSFSELLSFYTPATSGELIKTLRKYVETAQLDTTHFAKRPTTGPRLNSTDIFVNGRLMTQKSLRTKYIALHPGKYLCECGLGPVWMGKPLKLQLDHRDGDRRNNLLSNLRFLCPNCHFLTPTHSARNAGRFSKTPTKNEIDVIVNARKTQEDDAPSSLVKLSSTWPRSFFLKAKTSQKSVYEISNLCGISRKKIAELLRHYKIEIKSRTNFSKTSSLTKEHLETHFQSGTTISEIAKQYGCSHAAIKKRAFAVKADLTLRAAHLHRPRKQNGLTKD